VAVVAIVLANAAAFAVYVALPVAFPRPPLGSSLAERVLAAQYAADFSPGANKLPSMRDVAAMGAAGAPRSAFRPRSQRPAPPSRRQAAHRTEPFTMARSARSCSACEYPAVVGTRLSEGRCGFEESASQARHLFDELRAEPIAILSPGEMLDLIGDSPDDRHLRSNVGEARICGEPAVVF
jgi:hypothetical protein